MTSDRLVLRLPQALRSRLEMLSQSTGKTETELARRAIEDFLDRHASMPTSYELAEHAGVIGCIISGQGDLSTNLKHRQGFGK